jgi:hypothetical protein
MTHCDSSLLHTVVLENILARTTSKTPFPRIPGVFTSPLPTDGRPSIVACAYVTGVFTEPLPSNGSVCYNIINCLYQNVPGKSTLYTFMVLLWLGTPLNEIGILYGGNYVRRSFTVVPVT